YLLTGRPPFEDADVLRIIERVRTETAPSVVALRSDVPRGLANVVARCLAKTPAERVPDYAALSAALEPYRSVTRTAAPLWRRVLASLLDNYATNFLTAPISFSFGLALIAPEYRWTALLASTLIIAVEIGYFATSEGLFGASV